MAERIRTGLPKESMADAIDNTGSTANDVSLNLEDTGWLGDKGIVSLELV